jgi:hypothetical protein
MATAEQLSENSRQGFEVQKQTCIGLTSDLSGNLRWGCGHAYDETPVGIAVYVRNDPVNLIDPDGKQPTFSVTVWGWGAAFLGLGWYSNDDYITYSFLSSRGFIGQFQAQLNAFLQNPMQPTSAGGSGQGPDYWRPPLDSTQISEVMAASAVASARINNPRSDCNRFLTNLLHSASTATGQTYAVDMLNDVSARTDFFNGSVSPMIVTYNGQQTTIAALFNSRPNILAHTETLSGRTNVYLNETFFASSNQGQRAPTLAHEYVHGLNTAVFTDEFLARLIGWNGQGGQSGASQHLSNRFQAECGH